MDIGKFPKQGLSPHHMAKIKTSRTGAQADI
jgi:hypothetical protein